jgi:hypothetical protein
MEFEVFGLITSIRQQNIYDTGNIVCWQWVDVEVSHRGQQSDASITVTSTVIHTKTVLFFRRLFEVAFGVKLLDEWSTVNWRRPGRKRSWSSAVVFNHICSRTPRCNFSSTLYPQKMVVYNSSYKTPWPEPASQLYQPSDCRLSAKLVPTFADRGYHVVSVTDPYGHILGFLDP